MKNRVLKNFSTYLPVLVLLLLVSACAVQRIDDAKTMDTSPVVKPPIHSTDLPDTKRQENYFIRSDGAQVALATPVKKIALAIQAQRLEYNGKALTDCSGIFHRFMKEMEKQYPEYTYPSEEYRSTRDLARWYHERRELKLIKNGLASDSVIKPGAVLFYGYRKTKYTHFTEEDLFVHGSGINHMGVVVDVTRDDEGNVQSYRLFHGHGKSAVPAKGNTPRKPGTYASITKFHTHEPTRATYPPLGNGTEQWIAFARLLPNSP